MAAILPPPKFGDSDIAPNAWRGPSAVAGVALAFWATDYLTVTLHNSENPIPAYMVFDIDGRVLSFVVGVTVFAAVGSGFIPAWLASRPNAVEALKESVGSIDRVLAQLIGGIQSGMGYLGAANLAQLREKARYIRVSPAGQREAAPHDVVELKTGN